MRIHLATFLFLLLGFTSYADSTSRINITDSTHIGLVDSLVTDSLKLDSANLQSIDSAENSQILYPEGINRTKDTEVWVFIVCCIAFFLAGLNRRIDEKKHDQSILGFFNFGSIGQATDRSFYEFNVHQLFGLIVHNLILSLWCFYFLRNTDYQFEFNNLLFYILLFFLISIIYLCKFFFQYLSLNILQIHDLPVLLVKCTIGIGYIAMLVSLPFFMVIYYVQFPEWQDKLINIFIILMSGYLIFRSIKYFQLFMQFFRTSIFYNILYFCGLELIPLLVFIKISLSIFKIN